MDAAKGGGASSASSSSRRSEAGATRQAQTQPADSKKSEPKATAFGSDRATVSQEVHQKAEASSVLGGLADWFGGSKESKPESAPELTDKQREDLRAAGRAQRECMAKAERFLDAGDMASFGMARGQCESNGAAAAISALIDP